MNLTYDENKLYETLHYWFRCMLNFWFLDKSVGTVPNAWWLLTAFFHFSNMKSKQYCVLNSLQRPHWNVGRILSKNVESCFLHCLNQFFLSMTVCHHVTMSILEFANGLSISIIKICAFPQAVDVLKILRWFPPCKVYSSSFYC